MAASSLRIGSPLDFASHQPFRRIGFSNQLDRSYTPHDGFHLSYSLLSIRNDFSFGGETDVKKIEEDRECRGKNLRLFDVRFDHRDLCHWILSHPMDGNPSSLIGNRGYSHSLCPCLWRLLP